MRFEHSGSVVESVERGQEKLDMGWLGFAEEWRVRQDDHQCEVYLGLERRFVAVVVGRNLDIMLVGVRKCRVAELLVSG